MDERTQPRLFEDPLQPETPAALLQKQKHALLRRALFTKDSEERRRLAKQWVDLHLKDFDMTMKDMTMKG